MIRSILICLWCIFYLGCVPTKVDIVKTGKGIYNPTNPNNVEILKYAPSRPFEEVATVSAFDFDNRDIAKMHNSIRAKTAPLGADAVILSSEGFMDEDDKIWAKGVALHYKDGKN